MPGFHNATAELRAIYRQMWLMKYCSDNDMDINDEAELKEAERSYITYSRNNDVKSMPYEHLMSDICDFALIDDINAYDAVSRYSDRVNPNSWESIVNQVKSDVISSVETRARTEALEYHEWNSINDQYLTDRERDAAALYENLNDGGPEFDTSMYLG